MSELDHVVLLAKYNTWMNAKLYEAAATLPPEALHDNRGAFFGSLMGTLNHIVAGDTIWLQRFAAHPAPFPELDPVRALSRPAALNAPFSDNLTALHAHREMLDGVIERWVGALTDQHLRHVLHYRNSQGAMAKRLSLLLVHFFNHQTHHRGQASTLLSQAGVDIGVTDLLALIPNEA
jgi:uncharacterized damage-inducible protein DinB